jgi:hypothetical protein
MRAREFISEQAHGSLQPGVAEALPSTFIIPGLPNQNSYVQYRYGVALAGAGAKEALEKEGMDTFHKESPWGDGMIIVAYDESEVALMKKALAMMNVGGATQISTAASEESPSTGKTSPVRSFKGVLK